MAYTHKMVNGEKVALTDAEIKELEARDAVSYTHLTLPTKA